MFINVYYYFNTTTNSESKDFSSVFLDQEFDVNLNEVDRQLIANWSEDLEFRGDLLKMTNKRTLLKAKDSIF